MDALKEQGIAFPSGIPALEVNGLAAIISMSTMQHRAILRAAKTGTITHTQARDAARAVKRHELPTRTQSAKGVRSASTFGFGFGPAMADPKGPATVRAQKRAAKKR